MSGFGLTLIPFSWALGVWRRAHKTIWAIGPLRISVHRGLARWREERC